MSPHRCHVKLVGRGCEHDLCVTLTRGVPEELRCEEAAPAGYGSGGSSSCGCHVPAGLEDLVARQLRDNLQESRRRGFVLIQAA
jgi:hypothetical protein